MAVSGLPDLSDFCIELSTGPGEICIRFPGGTQVCAQFGFEIGDNGEIIRSLLAEANAALSPLQPFFNTLDVIKAIVDCIQAIPDCITQFSPEPILSCIPDLVKKLMKLLQLIPQLSVPILIADLLEAIIVGLIAIRAELAAMIRQNLKILAAGTRAAEVGNVELQAVVDCATGNLEAQLINKNASLAPLNRLIGVMNLLLELAGLQPVPSLDNLENVDDAALAGLDASIQVLETARAALPV
jgi:hypothetical protein